MISKNIVKKLQKEEGFKVEYGKYIYWDGIPYIELNGGKFFIAECVTYNNATSVNTSFIYTHVLDAITTAKDLNPFLNELIQKDSWNGLYYEQYKINCMTDYYMYQKNEYPWDNWRETRKHLEKKWLFAGV